MKKWSDRNYLCGVVAVMLAGCLCWGCGSEREEVMAGAAGQEAAADAGVGGVMEREPGVGAELTEAEDGENGVSGSAPGQAGSNGVDGNVLGQAGENGVGVDVPGQAGSSDVSGNASGQNGANGMSGNVSGQLGTNGVSGKAAGRDAERGGSGNTSGQDQEKAAGEQEIPRREPVKVKGIYVSGPVAGIARMDELIELVEQTELNAMVIDIKNDEGKVTYDMQSAQVLEIEASIGYIPDIEVLVRKCKEKDIYLIARIVAFRDPFLAEKKPEWAVHTKDGGIFRDKNGLAWVNPYERGVWDYLVEIASEAAAVGFDEIQFDYIRFSTDVKTDEVDYGSEDESIGKIGIITEFTEYVYEKLRPLGVYVAADVFGTVIENETDQQIVGQDYVEMAKHLDYICPMIYPSHYRNGSYGIAVPDADPYGTINGACSASAQELGVLPKENRAQVRAWLQSFTASWVPGHISYGPKQIRAQIKGAYDAGYDEWILWNAAVKYQRDSLLTKEEAEAERQQWEKEKQEAAAEESVPSAGGQEPEEQDLTQETEKPEKQGLTQETEKPEKQGLTQETEKPEQQDLAQETAEQPGTAE